MKKLTRMILITLISILLIFSIPLYSKATEDETFSLDSIISDGNSFLNIDKNDDENGIDKNIQAVPSEISDTNLSKISNMVSGVLLTIALIVTLISAVMMGINFTIQSVEDKAKIKESMIPWVIGIFISFGAYGIWKLTMGIFYRL